LNQLEPVSNSDSMIRKLISMKLFCMKVKCSFKQETNTVNSCKKGKACLGQKLSQNRRKMQKKRKKNKIKRSLKISWKVVGNKPLKELLSSTKQQKMSRDSLWMREKSKSVMKEILNLKRPRRP
jgi:hypothetical protein